MVYKYALIAALMIVADAKKLHNVPVYDNSNILLAMVPSAVDEEAEQQNFEDDTVDEVHDYTPETQLI